MFQTEIIEKLSKVAGGQKELAKIIGKPQSRISEYHTGKHNMSVATLLFMIKKLGLTLKIE
jgi:predicted XRE-type DNA-binding protein